MAMYFGDQRPGGYDLAKREFYCPACLETQEPKIEIGELGDSGKLCRLTCRNPNCDYKTEVTLGSEMRWGNEKLQKQAAELALLGEWRRVPPKNKSLTSSDIELRLANHFDYRKNLVVPNVYFKGQHECDVLIVTSSGYATEIEIKISVSDFKADFAKGHHHRNAFIKRLYYCVPSDIREKIEPMVPADAGLIVVDTKTLWLDIVKEAPARPHPKPLTHKEFLELYRLGALRIWDLKAKLMEKRLREWPLGQEMAVWFDENGERLSPAMSLEIERPKDFEEFGSPDPFEP